MPKHRNISGKQCIKILTKEFGFDIVRKKGSHIVLQKSNGEKITTIVPDHKELKIGTLKEILKLARISFDEFSKKLNRH